VKTLRTAALAAFLLYIALAAFQMTRQPLAQAFIAKSARAQAAGTPAPAQALAAVHIVARGDVLWRIAQEYGVTVEAIAAANPAVDLLRLEVGAALIIPLTGFPTPTATPAPPTFTPVPADQTVYPTALEGFPTAQNLPPTATLPATPTPPPPAALNGIALDRFMVMPPDVVANAQAIFAAGQALGNDPAAFSKVGDSTIESPFFMDRFDDPDGYHLGDYAYLQPAIDRFRGSFARDSVAVRVALHSWSVFDPMWSDPARCQPAETAIACEFRLNRPSAVFIRLGSNDMGVPEYFERSMRRIIEFSIAQGIIPIVGTKADRNDGPANTNNEILRALAAEYAVPLWDFDLLAATLPNRGLLGDGTHMTTFYLHDWRQPQGLQTGHGVHSLAGLMMLDRVWRAAMGVPVP
jgi:LysM repeat protein